MVCLRRAAGLAFSLGVVSCGDPAAYRPAKGASDMPSTKTAYRVKSVPPDCVLLGFVNAEGSSALDDISTTAARHGGNTYLVTGDDGDERVTTDGIGERVTRTNHKLVAQVFRCPMSDDLPK